MLFVMMIVLPRLVRFFHALSQARAVRRIEEAARATRDAGA